MQHQQRVSAQEAGRVDAERQILAHTLIGVSGYRFVGLSVGPGGLHTACSG
jgi:hypothetical protein